MVAYSAAAERMLPNILSHMINQGVPKHIADQIYGTRDRWMTQFVNALPSTPIQENDFQNFLYRFLTQMVQQNNAPANNNMFGGGSRASIFGNTFGGGGFPNANNNPNPFGDGMFASRPSFMNSPGGGFSGFSNPMVNNTPTIPTNPFNVEDSPLAAPSASKGGIIEKNDSVVDSMVFSEYVPLWKKDPSKISVITESCAGTDLTAWMIPSDDRTPSFTRIEVESKHVMCEDDIKRMMDAINADRYIAMVSYMEPFVVDVDKEEFISQLETIRSMATGQGEATTKIKLVLKHIDTLPRGMYNIFEKIIIDTFNECLKVKMLQDSSTARINIEVTSADNLLEFAPASASKDLDRLITIPNYINAFNSVLEYVLLRLTSISIVEDHEEITSGMYSQKGISNYIQYLKVRYKQKIDNNRVVFSIPRKIVITNMDISGSASVTEAKNKKHSIRDVSSHVIDHILTDSLDSVQPLRVLSQGSKFYVGYTIDQSMVYAI